ncbi:MAG: redox-sensitive bicupin YhaK (pirin superfamily) [Lentisphaeria bacterium]|jgi:redox-sensitive bicupin YhaK (pirin superfamily)
MNTRKVIEQMKARPASDGDGVKLLRVFGGQQPERFDPFLLMDEFGSDKASDYIGGFPAHPHRGFETITYMLQGKMEHRDHMDNVGLINDGDVQWMTAGKGIIHSEMPRQTEGEMRGFQIWLNLPARNKMKPAVYKDVPGDNIPTYASDGVFIKAIAGKTTLGDVAVNGYFDIADTEAVYLDVHLAKGKQISLPIATDLNTLVYMYEGKVALGDNMTHAGPQTLSRMNTFGDLVIANTGETLARLLVLAGKPLREPIAQHGPFVMNTYDEINQAVEDYRNGVLTD